MKKKPSPRDPRPFQILALASLLLYGVTVIDLRLSLPVAAAIFTAALTTQGLASALVGLRFDPRSAVISSLSLCLLLRTSSPTLAAAVATITIASKFLVRSRGKHLFNPTNFGLTAGLLLFEGIWVSPGQWGSVAFFGFLLACAGTLVVHRSRRSDVTWAFLAVWAGLLVGRALWLGDPLAIPAHQLRNGGLLIFAFFMISDPKTTPDHRFGRIFWAVAIAGIAGYIQFGLFRPNALLWALMLSTPLVPLLDRCFPAARYIWGARPNDAPKNDAPKEVHRETPPPLYSLLARRFGSLGAPRLGVLRFLRRQG